MDDNIQISILVEGRSDEVVAKAICHEIGISDIQSFGMRGKGYIDKHLLSFNKAAQFSPWIVFRDLDHDAECAPELLGNLLPHPSKHMIFRIAVREIEAWLLADADQFSEFFSVTKSKIPIDPDRLDDPKEKVIQIAKRSRKKLVREGIVPRPGSGVKIGPFYTALIIEYASQHWRPNIAAKRSDSLRRCLDCLKRIYC